MERRVALKNMAAAMGAMAVLPAWASGWNQQSIGAGKLLVADQSLVLNAVVESIIPKTDTPGAGELGVANFVQKMVKDCYDKKSQATLSDGIDALNAKSVKTIGQGFAEVSKEQKLKLLQDIEKNGDAEQKAFLSLVKNLTIQGYMNSEYVMTNITHYEMVPARYHGCVPVKK